MAKDKEGHGIVLDDKGQEQPADKDRADGAQDRAWSHARNKEARQA